MGWQFVIWYSFLYIIVIRKQKKRNIMSVVKVIEVIASSDKSVEDAMQKAVSEASKTVENIDSVWVKDIKAHVKDGKITTYGVITKISFRLNSK